MDRDTAVAMAQQAIKAKNRRLIDAVLALRAERENQPATPQAIDELPVIARGFTEPLQENMTFALEPKKGIPGVGMVGTENTFVVTPGGGRCLTGNHPGLLPVCND